MPKEPENEVDPTDPIDAAVTGLNYWMVALIHGGPAARDTPTYNAIHHHVQAITSELHKLKGD